MTPFDWRNFLVVADWLDERAVDSAAPAADDAVTRTVIGRAYYSAFHIARLFVENLVRDGVLAWPATRQSIHDKVWIALSAHQDPSIVELARKGALLKGQRTEADYSVAPNRRRALIAEEARRNAREIVSGLDAWQSSKT